MESGIRSIFLAAAICLALFTSELALAQEPSAAPQVIEPAVERRDLNVSAIDTEDFEITAFFGAMSVEDFETNAVYGARVAYHVNPALFIEGSYGRTEVGESSAEVLNPGVSLLTDRALSYYDLSLGWNIFPGEAFFSSKRIFNSAFYLIGGLGSTDFDSDSNFTINFGFGFKLLPTDIIAIRLEARDYLFDSAATGQDKTTHNMQGTLNISVYF